ncbi:MAG: hypothetical protein ACOCXH_05740 [Cyclobacteriaceae bacterium]
MNAKPVQDNLFTDSIAKNTKNEFNYYVIAVDSSYNKSAYSKAVSAILPDVTAPSAPFITSIIPANNGLLIKWNRSLDSDIATYILTRIQNSDTLNSINYSVKPDFKQFQDDNIMDKVIYTYYLQSLDSSGNMSEESNRVSAVFEKEKSITAIQFKGEFLKDANTIDLTWHNPEDDHVKGVIISKMTNESWKPISGLLAVNSFQDTQIQIHNYYKISIIGKKFCSFSNFNF